MPAFTKAARIRSPSSGVSSDGLRATALPAIRAIATSPNGIDHG